MPSSNESQNPATNKPKITLADLRNTAIIIACLAVAYKSFTPVTPAAPAQQPPAAVAAVTPASTPDFPTVMAPALPGSTPDKVKEKTGVTIINGRLTLGNDEASDNFRKYLANRIQTLNQQGPVRFTPPPVPNQAPAHAPSSSNTATGADQPAVAHTSAPVVRSDVEDPAATLRTEQGTLHPAPFTDRVAKASIDAKSKYVMDNKIPATVKIGFHLDGTTMTVAESEQQVRDTLSRIQDEWTLIYKAPNEKVRLYVFTDTTCPYCQKLHKSMDQLLSAGISVHYFLYPRDMANMPEGTLSSTALNLQNVWCSLDQKDAMDSAFLGYKIPKADCSTLPETLHRWPSPVANHYMTGDMFNVTGTPAWFASNGKHDIGFSTAQTMIQTLLGE